jgi:hypothetical protein
MELYSFLLIILGIFIWEIYTTSNGIILPDLLANCQMLLDTGQLLKGHAKFQNVYDVCTQLHLCDCVLCHVSAHGLKSLVAPSSLKSHQKMDLANRPIWDAAYYEEYDGLCSLPSWEVINEDQYCCIS